MTITRTTTAIKHAINDKYGYLLIDHDIDFYSVATHKVCHMQKINVRRAYKSKKIEVSLTFDKDKVDKIVKGEDQLRAFAKKLDKDVRSILESYNCGDYKLYAMTNGATF